jgi:putative transposase
LKGGERMLALRAVRQKHKASRQLLVLMDEFRRMVNICITIGVEQNISSLRKLSSNAYHLLSSESLGYYRLCAISSSIGILRNYRRAKNRNRNAAFPYASRLRLTTCYGFKVQGGVLKLPLKPRTYAYIKLNNHTLRMLHGMKVRSITITPDALSISYSKEPVEIKPEGCVGLELNLDNVTIASTDNTLRKFDLSKAREIKSTYRYVKSRVGRNDSRTKRVVYAKYGKRERNRVQPLLHYVSKTIVEEAKARRYAIVMERLTRIRRLYRRGNGQSRNYRAKMNSWSFGELQRQIEYKARWEGLRVVYIPPRNTSKQCSICGYKTLESTKRKLWCPRCGAILDRDANAARNIIAAGGLRFSPNGPPLEAVVEEREPTDATLILKVDGGKPSLDSGGHPPKIDRLPPLLET